MGYVQLRISQTKNITPLQFNNKTAMRDAANMHYVWQRNKNSG